MKALYRGAQACVSLARLLSAAFYFAIAILLISFALWLALPFGKSWILTGIAILVGLQGAANGVKAAEIFLSTRPPERTTERQERAPSPRRNRDHNA
jgi:hypothetical protein